MPHSASSMKPICLSIALVASWVAVLSCHGQERSEPQRPQAVSENSEPREALPIFGPYQAIAINRGVVRDVKVDKEMNIYLQLFPAHKDKELVVKISDKRFAGYRNWFHGGSELVSPANAGKTPYGWTDWVQSKAKYIEYWMDGTIFLHLERTDL